MAKNISEVGIVDGQIVYADQILQLTDALRGDDAYNINLSGSISINDVTYPSTDGGVSGSVLMTDGSGTAGFGLVQSVPLSIICFNIIPLYYFIFSNKCYRCCILIICFNFIICWVFRCS